MGVTTVNIQGFELGNGSGGADSDESRRVSVEKTNQNSHFVSQMEPQVRFREIKR